MKIAFRDIKYFWFKIHQANTLTIWNTVGALLSYADLLVRVSMDILSVVAGVYICEKIKWHLWANCEGEPSLLESAEIKGRMLDEG